MGAEFWITLAIRLIILPIIMYVANYVVALLKAKAEEHIANVENEKVKNMLNEAVNIVSSCVLATTQTYVSALKEQGKFDMDAQKEALRITSEMAINFLPDETKAYIEGSYGDLDDFVTNLIEAQIAESKG